MNVIYSLLFVDNYQLRNEESKYDVVPEIVDGMNISDFIDPDIEELLDRLEVEEIEQLQELEATIQEDDDVEKHNSILH